MPLFYSFAHHCVAHPLLFVADVLRRVAIVVAALVTLHELTARQLDVPVCLSRCTFPDCGPPCRVTA